MRNKTSKSLICRHCTLTCSAHAGLQAGIAQRARRMRLETPASPPTLSLKGRGSKGLAVTPFFLRERRAPTGALDALRERAGTRVHACAKALSEGRHCTLTPTLSLAGRGSRSPAVTPAWWLLCLAPSPFQGEGRGEGECMGTGTREKRARAFVLSCLHRQGVRCAQPLQRVVGMQGVGDPRAPRRSSPGYSVLSVVWRRVATIQAPAPSSSSSGEGSVTAVKLMKPPSPCAAPAGW